MRCSQCAATASSCSVQGASSASRAPRFRTYHDITIPHSGMLTPATRGIMLALRIALREMRGGLRGFYVLTACIALGVMAVARGNSLASRLAHRVARGGRSIFGGGLAFFLSLRE